MADSRYSRHSHVHTHTHPPKAVTHQFLWRMVFCSNDKQKAYHTRETLSECRVKLQQVLLSHPFWCVWCMREWII